MAKRTQPDPKEPDTRIVILDFPGMTPGIDLHDAHPGASWFQVNAVSFRPGELRCRGGFRVVKYEK